MGWSYGTNSEGREVGYSVAATCDMEGCKAEIDRGLSYACGPMHGFNEHDCDKYFCGEHLTFTEVGQLCLTCAEKYEKAHPETEEAA